MMKKHNVLSLVLAFCLCFMVAMPAWAANYDEIGEFSGPKINLTYEQGSMFDMFNNYSLSRNDSVKSIYTYEQNGRFYKVYGEISNDLIHSYSEIYELNDDGELLVRTEQVDNIDGFVYITIDNKGKKTFEIMNMNSNNVFVDEEGFIFDNEISPLATWGDGWPVNDYFTFHHAINNRYKITVISAEAVSVIITSIVSATDMPKEAKIITPIITFIVAKIVELTLPDVYTREEVSYRWTNVPNAPLQQRAVERVVRTFYSDRAHNNEIGEPVVTYVYDSYYNE